MEYFDGVIAAKLFSGNGGTGEPVDISGKLDKVTTTALVPRVYGVETDGSQKTYFLTPTADANTIVMRDESKHIAVEDGVAPKQAVNKSQLDKKLDLTGGHISGDLSIAGNVDVVGVSTHTAEAIFNGGLESDAPVSVNNSFVKITKTQGDVVTQYGADKIMLEENGETKQYNYTFPRSSGTLAVTAHSAIKNEDTNDEHIDSWSTDDSSSISIYSASDTDHAGILVQRGYSEIAYSGTSHTSRVSVGDGAVSLISQGLSYGASTTSLVVSEDGATINGKKIVVSDEIVGIPSHITITAPEGATSGTLDETQLQTLRANLSNFIVFAHKEYHLKADGLVEGYLTYTYNGYENNRHIQECITITISTRGWVLNRGVLVTSADTATGTRAGVVTVDDDFSKGLTVSDKGNLGVYRALDADITSRSTTRPITPLNLNNAVVASLTDNNKIVPTTEQKTSFKNAWGITNSSGAQVVLASDEPSPANYSDGDVFINTSNECFYCLKNGAWEIQDSFGKPSWHATAPTDTTKVLRTEITWDKNIQYKSGSTDTIACSFRCSGDGYARFENATGEQLLQGCTNWSVTGSSKTASINDVYVVINGSVFYEVDSNLVYYTAIQTSDGASVNGMFYVPTTATFRYLY